MNCNKTPSLLLYLIFVLAITFNSCKLPAFLMKGKKTYEFDTAELHKQTQRIGARMTSIDSIAQVVGTGICDDINMVDTLQEQYSALCNMLQAYNFDDKSLLEVANCVVKEKTIEFSTPPKYDWFQEEMLPVDSLLNLIDNNSKKLLKRLKRDCLKRYETCRTIIKNRKNQELIKDIKELVAIKNLSDDEFFKDSTSISKKVRKYRAGIGDGERYSPFYQSMVRALAEDVHYRLAHEENQQRCNRAHIRWADLEKFYISEEHICEAIYIADKSARKWDITIDSQWVSTQKEISKNCALKPRGCMCAYAINYDADAELENGTCIGCMDPLALNYCPKANRQTNAAPCKYAACTNGCFEEELSGSAIQRMYPLFKKGRDELVQTDSMCITNRCGCTNPCASNYDSTATKDDGTCSGVVCGCLDSTAVNYAWRNGKNSITKHDSTLCHWNGCTNRCAKNYDEKARNNDGSCICETITAIELDRMITEARFGAADRKYDAKLLESEFKSLLSRSIKKYSDIDFNRIGADLVIDVLMSEMKIQSGSVGNFELGVYQFRPIIEMVDILIEFLIAKSKEEELVSNMMSVKLVGEADGHPIRGEGIEFKNTASVMEEGFHLFPNGTNTSIGNIRNGGLDFTPNNTRTLHPNQRFNENETLAFLRAYMVKQQIVTILSGYADLENKILVGAMANTAKGRKYRKVTMSFTLVGFYKEMEERMEVDNTEIARLKEAKLFFENNGYPDATITYETCPCIEK